MARSSAWRRRLTRPPAPPDGMLWDNKLGWIPHHRKIYAARYRLAFQNVPDWRDDPTYDLVKRVKAKAKRKAAAAKRKATIAARKQEEHP